MHVLQQQHGRAHGKGAEHVDERADQRLANPLGTLLARLGRADADQLRDVARGHLSLLWPDESYDYALEPTVRRHAASLGRAHEHPAE